MERDAKTTRVITMVAAGLLCAIAAIGVVAILSDADDVAAGKVSLAALALTILSLAAMAGIVLSVRRPGLAWFGYATTVLALAAFALVTRKIWDGNFLNANWELASIAAVVAVACGQISLLLAWVREASWVRWLALSAAGAIAALAALTVLEIAIDDVEVSPRVFALLAIVYLLGIALLPLFTLSEKSGASDA